MAELIREPDNTGKRNYRQSSRAHRIRMGIQRSFGNNGRMRRQNALILLVLFFVTLGLYLPTVLKDAFVNYDDPAYVTSNTHVQSGLRWQNALWAFKSGDASNWHPLTWISHMADCQFYGLNPRGHHFTSVLFHVANTMLLFALLQRMTGAIWRSAAAAALFGWHPLRVESVAWVAERKDVLGTFFWLLTMMAYARYAEGNKDAKPEIKRQKSEKKKPQSATRNRHRLFYGLSLLCFALGLMSKPMLVTLPFAMLLVDFWPLGRISNFKFEISNRGSFGWLLLEKAPFFLLAIVSSAVTFFEQKRGGAVSSLTVLTIGQRFANALVSYLRYVGKFLCPINLSVLYPHPRSWPIWLVVASGVFLVVVSAAAIICARRKPYLFVGWFWFLGCLVPVIGLVQVGVQSIADRYTYVPGIGLLMIVCWGVPDLRVRWLEWPRVVAVGCGAALAACLAMTFVQAQYWKNSLTLFAHAVAVTSNNYLAYNNLGYFLDHEGKVDEALANYQKSVDINPNYDEAQNNLGYALAEKGRHAEAVTHYIAALTVQPKLAEAHNNLANALSELGKSDEALSEYQRALELNPEHADAHNNIGIALAMRGRYDEAVAHLKEAIRLRPSYASAHSNLGNALAVQHKLDEASKEYEIALQLTPNDPQAHNNLGNVLSEEGRLDDAAAQYARALELKADNPEANYNLGMVLLRQGKRNEALKHFQEALRLRPGYAEAQQQVNALSQAGH
jgi:tetratricopeptide (TPR) repeat protein